MLVFPSVRSSSAPRCPLWECVPLRLFDCSVLAQALAEREEQMDVHSVLGLADCVLPKGLAERKEQLDVSTAMIFHYTL